MPRTVVAAVAAIGVTAALLAGCAASTVGGQGDATGVRVAPTGAASRSASTGTRPTDVGAKSIVELTPTAGATSAGRRDFTAARFATPAGWERVSTYYQVVPLEDGTYLSYYTKPTSEIDSKGVVSVLIYALPRSGLVGTTAQQRARVEYYTKKVKATVLEPVTQTGLAGRTAYREQLSQPGGYDYTTWFVFGTQHVLQLSCQRGAASEAAKIDAGCTSVVSSLSVS